MQVCGVQGFLYGVVSGEFVTIISGSYAKRDLHGMVVVAYRGGKFPWGVNFTWEISCFELTAKFATQILGVSEKFPTLVVGATYFRAFGTFVSQDSIIFLPLLDRRCLMDGCLGRDGCTFHPQWGQRERTQAPKGSKGAGRDLKLKPLKYLSSPPARGHEAMHSITLEMVREISHSSFSNLRYISCCDCPDTKSPPPPRLWRLLH